MPELGHLNDYFPRLFGAFLCLGFLGVVFVTLSRGKHLVDHGDIHTDQRAIVAAEEFRALGVSELHYMQTEDSIAQLGFNPSYYHRHPAGGVMALAILQDMGLDRTTIRLLPLLATTIGLWGFFCFLRVVTRNPIFSLVGAGMLASASPFYLLSDSFQLYSYALMGKGISFWLIARGSLERGRTRLKFFSLNMLTCFLTVAFLGLESMPAVGLASFVAPLLLVHGRLWSRFLVACVSAALTALGMILGWGLLIRNMLAAFENDFDRTVNNLTSSLSSRSVGREFEINSAGRDYLDEVAYRFSQYLPVHLILGGLGLAVTLYFVFKLRNDNARRILIATAICLLAELPYFIFMRRHVYMHPHTTVHITLAAASLAALFFGLWAGRNRRFSLIGGTLGIVALGLVLQYSPASSFGNLVQPEEASNSNAVQDEMATCLESVPENSLLLVNTDDRYSWYLRCFAAMKGIRSIELPPDGDRILVLPDPESGRMRRRRSGELNIPELVDLPFIAGCPIYLVAELRDKDVIEAAEARYKRLATSRRFALFGVARCQAPRQPLVTRVPVTTLREFVQTSPNAEEALGARVNFPLTSRHRNGVWLHAPPASLGKPTTVRVDVDEVNAITEAACAFDYHMADNREQPDVVITMRIYDGVRLVGIGSRTASPGAPAKELEFKLDSAAKVSAIEFDLELAESERHNTLARVVVRRVDLRQ